MVTAIPRHSRSAVLSAGASLLVFSLIIVALTIAPEDRQAHAGTFPGTNGRIAFVSMRDFVYPTDYPTLGTGEIYVMNADGSGQTRLTNNERFDWDPNWSPDGTKIAYSSSATDGTNSGIYVMNADGRGETRLTNNIVDSHPSWSPDGTRIAYASQREDGFQAVWVMNADGSGDTRLTNLSNEILDDAQPTWSPDGTKIAFTRNGKIYVMNADGSDQTRLTDNGGIDREPNWSPDGSKIAFTSQRDDQPHYIYVMNADGSAQTKLYGLPLYFAGDPSWSPDGTKIAFMTDFEVYAMNADGSGTVNLSNNWQAPVAGNNQEYDPDWGTSLAPVFMPSAAPTDAPVAALAPAELPTTGGRNGGLGPAWLLLVLGGALVLIGGTLAASKARRA